MTTRRADPATATFAVVTGGGTAGHVHPALAVGEALVGRGHEAASIRFVGARRGIEARLVPAAGFEVTLLSGRGIQRRLTLQNLGAIVGLAVACGRALVLLARWRPRVTVTVGGYAGVPASLASVLLRVPLVVVNVDAVPGASNRLAGRFAAASAVGFPGTPLPRAVVTGAPVRASVLEADRSPSSRAEVRAEFQIREDRLLLLVAGGSLGAGRINSATLGLAKAWASRGDVTVFHVAGDRNLATVGAEAAALDLGPCPGTDARLDYRCVGYEARLPALLAACDLAVCRAGASTVAELSAIGTPSILVPLPGAPGDHQTKNAESLEHAGAAITLSDGDCTPERLEELVSVLFSGPSRLETMGLAAGSVGHRDAADRVAALAESKARGPR